MTKSITVKNITKAYGDFVAVENLSFEIPQGSIYGLLGPNGAGKTTTIRMLVNVTVPDSGEVRLFGEPMTSRLQERVGYLPEDRGLYKKMKVGEQLAFFAQLKSVKSDQIPRKVDEWLERIGLTQWKNKRWDELSKGMQQKVQFASTILHDPDLVILDEPFSGLDPINANLLKDIVQEMKKKNKTIIFSTHLMAQAEELCDSICLINRGHKVLDGPIKEIKRSFGHRAIEIDGEDIDHALEDLSLIASYQKLHNGVEVHPAAGIDATSLLQRLVNDGVRLRRFELVEYSLNDIFIKTVSQMDSQADSARV